MTNRLAHETSPYLRQHQDNPVDWHAWGDDAFAEARRRDVPVLVSIGYSTCHWCHVMAHESFENEAIARQVNEHFVAIKVDREERPDVDAIYMQAAQAMGNQGGWPLNVFVTPDRAPFFAGTYWPPHDHPTGMPGFRRVLDTIHHYWTDDRERLLEGGQAVVEHLRQIAEISASPSPLSAELFDNAVTSLWSTFDRAHGGFGGAPKFPQPSVHTFLLREYARSGNPRALEMVRTTLEAMAEGGIQDHLAGGFARYSVDAEWHVPHFEKMLYDNAQLLELYADLYLATGDPLFRHTGVRIATWAINEMTLPGGAFAAALDADSEGREGAFYVWTEDEIRDALPADTADLAIRHFGIATPGSFEGANVLRIAESAEEMAPPEDTRALVTAMGIEEMRATLLERREQRERPGRDDKVITAWNGLMIHALASTAHTIGIGNWVPAAERAATFVVDHLRRADGTLARSWADGQTRGDGTLEDYASLALGLIALYQATGGTTWLTTARELFDTADQRFRHGSGVGYYDAPDQSDLIVRPREMSDGATASGNAQMVELAAILGTMQQDDDLLATARDLAESMARPMHDHPQALGYMLAASLRLESSPREIVFAGTPDAPGMARLQQAAGAAFDPMALLGWTTQDTEITTRFPMLADRPQTDAPSVYVCQDRTCLPPISDPAHLLQVLHGESAL